MCDAPYTFHVTIVGTFRSGDARQQVNSLDHSAVDCFQHARLLCILRIFRFKFNGFTSSEKVKNFRRLRGDLKHIDRALIDRASHQSHKPVIN